MGYEPENTLRSFEKAIELGADIIELDVHLCKSGELVVIHDEKVNRTTNGRGLIADMALAELKKLDAGNGQIIPTLEDVVDFVGSWRGTRAKPGLCKRVAINIELKGAGTALPVASVLYKLYRSGWKEDQFLVSSFSIDELQQFRNTDSVSRVGLILDKSIFGIWGSKINIFDLALTLKCYSIHPSVRLTTPKLVREAHSNGLKVFVWTANSSADIRRLIKMGVDGIFSNFPDRLA